MIRGFQGNSPGTPGSVAACAKHFAGYGAAEAGRDYNSTFISESQLREVYLPPFREAVRRRCRDFHDLLQCPEWRPCHRQPVPA